MEGLTIRLAEFEGPMDVLLHLIKELKIDIYDIPMVELTNQYLEFIHNMQEMELEVAGEYLVMAATLIEIKARMLLPKPTVEVPEDEELAPEDPREELVQKLLEYKQFQESAKQLEALSIERSQHYGKQASDLSSLQGIIPLKDGEITTQDLWNALKKMAQRSIAKRPMQANIQHETHTVEEMMDYILSQVKEHAAQRVPFERCFPEINRSVIVSSFLAVLQLVRERKIRLIQHVPYEAIYIEASTEQPAEKEGN